MIPGAILFAAALAYALMRGDWRFTLALLGVAAVGVSVYVFLPLRRPTSRRSTKASRPPGRRCRRCSPASSTASRRSPSGRPTSSPRCCMWVQYFTWQWGHDLARNCAGDARACCSARWACWARGATGRPTAARRRDDRADGHAHAAADLLPQLQVRLLAVPAAPRCRARCASATTSSSARSRCGASGSAWASPTLMEWVAGRLARARSRTRRGAGRYALPVLLLALVPLVGNRLTASRAERDAGPRLRRGPAASRSSPTACSSPRATTTPSRCGTRRRSRACGGT